MYSTYKDMKELLQIHKNIVADCERQLANNKHEIMHLMGPVGFDGHGISYVDADNIHGGRPELRYDILEKFIDEQNKLYHMIEVSTNSIEYYQKIIDGLEAKLKGLEGLKYKVEYMHTIEEKTLQEIADELGYSYQYIKEVHTRK